MLGKLEITNAEQVQRQRCRRWFCEALQHCLINAPWIQRFVNCKLPRVRQFQSYLFIFSKIHSCYRFNHESLENGYRLTSTQDQLQCTTFKNQSLISFNTPMLMLRERDLQFKNFNAHLRLDVTLVRIQASKRNQIFNLNLWMPIDFELLRGNQVYELDSEFPSKSK